MVLTLIGLPAFYLRLRGQRGGRLGFFGLLFILVGSFLVVGMAGYFVSVLPVVAAKAPQILTATLESGFGIFPLGGTLFLTKVKDLGAQVRDMTNAECDVEITGKKVLPLLPFILKRPRNEADQSQHLPESATSNSV
jgi:hypothetical protein